MIATLLELQRLKQLDRTGWTLRGRGTGAESVAAHTYGVAVVAMLLADEARARGVVLDMERVLRLALLHDWAEARMGDLPRVAIDYYGSEVRRVAEQTAFGAIVSALGAEKAAAYSAWHEDYEQRASVEARLVKAADLIDLLLQALVFERAGARGLDEFWEGAERRDFGLEGATSELVGEVLRALLAEHHHLAGKTD